MKKNQVNNPTVSLTKFALVLFPEFKQHKSFPLLNESYELFFTDSAEKLKENFCVFCTNQVLEKKKSIESWMPYIESKLKDPDKRHIFEITDHTITEDIDFIMQMAYFLEADGVYVHQTHSEKVISYILANKKMFSTYISDSLFISNSDVFRKQIDTVDGELLQLLKRRTNLVDALADLKKQYNVPMLQHKRWNVLIEKRMKKAEQLGLDAASTLELFNVLHKTALAIHLKRYF